MQEKLIDFKTAILAKEKGFKEYVEEYFVKTKMKNHIREEHISDVKIEFEWYISRDNVYSRPTQSLLQKWLREIHSLHIDIRCDLNGGYYVYIMKVTGKTLYSNINTYKSYEEALEIGLIESLKLI